MSGTLAVMPEPVLRRAACPVCPAESDRLMLSLDFLAEMPPGMSLVRCRGCGTERIDPHPSAGCMADHYDDRYYQEGYLPFLERRRADFSRRLLELERLAPVLQARRQGRPPRVLDIGAGLGLFVAEARARGWQASGVEPSPAARRLAASHCRVDLAAQWPAACEDLDLVTFWDVLGHVDDPRAQLERARQVLRPGGGVVLKIPNFQSSWQRMLARMSVRRRVNMLHVPTVIWRFHRHGALRLLDQCGFTLAGVRTVREPDLVPLTPRWRLVRRVTTLLDAATDNRQEMILCMPAPVDLIFLAPGLGTGGTERHLAWLLPALQKRGLRLELWNTGEEGDAGRRLRQSGVTVRPSKAPLSARQVGRLAAWTTGLARRRPGLVHSYLYAHHWLDALACRLAGVTYVGSRRNLSHWRQGPVLARERWRDRSSAVIIANSAAAAAVAVREGADAGRLRVIANGVPLPAWAEHAWTDHEEWLARRRDARDALGLPDDARVTGAVMSLKAIKDPVTLLRAFAARDGLGPGDRLLFVGEGPLAHDLKGLAEDLGIAGQLVLAGRRAEPLELLAALDFFCLPSRSEGCSNAILEAMAAALPVVATAGGGNAEAVVAGETGRLIPPGDVDRLAAALDDVISDPGAAHELGRAGRRRARELFSLDTMVQRHVDLYAEFMAGRRTRVA